MKKAAAVIVGEGFNQAGNLRLSATGSVEETSPFRAIKKVLNLETNTLPKQPYLVPSGRGWLIFLLFFITAGVFSQQKFALVIGNGNYINISRLRNSVNDADDIAAVLEDLGFTVEKVLDGNLSQMQSAVTRFKNRLSISSYSYGFFFYAGHGVQSNGVNYLLPVTADIPGESYLRERAISVQAVMGELEEAGNDLNILVLDACRNNPFGWARDGSRGLALVSAPIGSIVMYATSANSVAGDGTERNGLFTSQLLQNLKTPGLNVQEVFNRTGQDVLLVSDGAQHPEISVRFFGNAYLGSIPADTSAPVVAMAQPALSASVPVGNITVTSEIAGIIFIDGISTGTGIKAGGTVIVTNVGTGETEVAVQENDGRVTKTQQPVMVQQGQTAAAVIKLPGSPADSAPVFSPAPPGAVIERPSPVNMVRINGGIFNMGSPAREKQRLDNEGPRHRVTISSFYIGRYEVTQKEYREIMGVNPSYFKGDNLPVEMVNWFDAIEYCNGRSRIEGLTPVYTINGNGDNRTVIWNRNANGYRLPTEAEWEFTCRAMTVSAFSTGNNITTSQANYNGNYPYNKNIKGTFRNYTTPAGSFNANPMGIYDMHGNVGEWCWDWFGNYSKDSLMDPAGTASGDFRVIRGGAWNNGGQSLRAAYRDYNSPAAKFNSLGFRLARG